jgi:hypothetical protein
MDEFGRSAVPHAGQGSGTLGCHGLLHPQAKPVAAVSRMGTMG